MTHFNPLLYKKYLFIQVILGTILLKISNINIFKSRLRIYILIIRTKKKNR